MAKRRYSTYRVREQTTELVSTKNVIPTGLKRLLEQKRRQVGCLILFFAIIFALMADRGVFFGILNEVGNEKFGIRFSQVDLLKLYSGLGLAPSISCRCYFIKINGSWNDVHLSVHAFTTRF